MIFADNNIIFCKATKQAARPNASWITTYNFKSFSQLQQVQDPNFQRHQQGNRKEIMDILRVTTTNTMIHTFDAQILITKNQREFRGNQTHNRTETPGHTMIWFKIPKYICRDIYSTNRNFFWNDNRETNTNNHYSTT